MPYEAILGHHLHHIDAGAFGSPPSREDPAGVVRLAAAGRVERRAIERDGVPPGHLAARDHTCAEFALIRVGVEKTVGVWHGRDVDDE